MPFHIQRVRIVFGGILLSLILAGCGANPQTSTPTNPVPSVTTSPSQPVPNPTTAMPQPVPSATNAPAPTTQSASNPTTVPTPIPASMTLVPTRTRPLPPAMVPTSSAIPITGEIPTAILAMMLADLSQRAGVATNELSIQVAEAVTWPDGSLGCPQPNMVYPQVLIDGYRAILIANGREYAYHSDTRGNAFYCAQPAR